MTAAMPHHRRRAAGRVFSKLLACAAVVLVAFACAGCPSTPVAASGTVSDPDATTYPVLEGFGAAGAYDADALAAFGAAHPSIYDDLFGTPASGGGLGLDIYRIRNTYQQTGDTNLAATGTIVAAAKARNANLKIELVPWSPPAGLKSNGDVNNGGTLAPGSGTYNYANYAT
jgi:O-glycosyl hydrolase